MNRHARDYARAAVQEHKDKQVPPALKKLWDYWDSIAPHRAKREIREWVATGNHTALKTR